MNILIAILSVPVAAAGQPSGTSPEPSVSEAPADWAASSEGEGHAVRHHEPHWILGTRPTAAWVDARDGSHDGYALGGALGAERLFFHHALAVELTVGWMRMLGMPEVPVDVAFSHPFRVGQIIEPYLAAGPRAVMVEGHDETVWHTGGFVATGAHVWGGAQLGTVLEINVGWVTGRVEEELVIGLAYRL